MAAFKKGNKLGKGRPKGSVNKRLALHEICEEHNLNAFEEVVVLATKAKPHEKFRMLMDLLPYLYPRLGNINVTIEDLSDEEVFAESRKRIREKGIGSPT